MQRSLLAILLAIGSSGLLAQDPCDSLVVDFSYASDPNGIAFEDQSTITGTITWFQWTFGDGNVSFVQNPVHEYDLNGTYEACLTIGTVIQMGDSSINCMDSVCYLIEYEQGGSGCDAYVVSFETIPGEGNSVIFYSTSDPIGGNNFWQFGDGNGASGQQVTHTFAEAGEYTVCLVGSYWNDVTQEFCTADVCAPVLVGDTLPCDSLIPSFVGILQEGTTFIFEETTDPAAGGFTWDFGDNSTASGPVVEHTYSSPGTYQVCMGAWWWNEVAQDSCWNNICDLFHVIVPEPCDTTVQIGFGWSQANGTATFQTEPNELIGGYLWDFGDGSTAIGTSVEHQFAVAGDHVVCLEAWYLPNELSDTCWTAFCDTITVGPGATNCDQLEAFFTYSSQPIGIQFANTSSIPGLPIAMEWNFGDGNASDDTDPLHPYAEPGSYEVCLTITTVIGPLTEPDTCSDTHCALVTWEGGGDPCAGLEATFIASAGGFLEMVFQSTTEPIADGYLWDFGDGTSATGETTGHAYAIPGNYEACLTAWWWNEATEDTCWSTTCELITVIGEVVECDSLFSIDFTWQQQANEIVFTAESSINDVNIIWDFGDGTNGAGAVVGHLYEPSGPYTVCASAWYWNESTMDTCWASMCHEVEWAPGGCDPEFHVEIAAEPAGNTVTFTAVGSPEAVGYIWDFGDGTSGTGVTITHAFEPPGPYSVCVIAWYWEPSIEDTCWADACINVDPFVGIAEAENSAGIVIFPQPANELITIDTRTTSAIPSEALLFSSDGRNIGTFPIKRLPHAMNVSDLAAGVYVLQLRFDDRLLQRRIVIE